MEEKIKGNRYNRPIRDEAYTGLPPKMELELYKQLESYMQLTEEQKEHIRTTCVVYGTGGPLDNQEEALLELFCNPNNMPTYTYHCDHCDQTKEIQHSMKFIDKENELPEDIKQQITCKGKLWKRIPSESNFKVGAFGAEARAHKESSAAYRQENNLH